MRYHRKIWLWWGPWWAVQLYVNHYVSLGVHLDWRKPLLDLHLGWLTIAFGDSPVMTPPEDAQRRSCRGFLLQRPVL
jgi:hypothetical protein